MNKFEWWLFKKLVEKIVVQGYQERLTEAYSIIYERAIGQFYEDNAPTLHDYMAKCWFEGKKLAIKNDKETIKT